METDWTIILPSHNAVAVISAGYIRGRCKKLSQWIIIYFLKLICLLTLKVRGFNLIQLCMFLLLIWKSKPFWNFTKLRALLPQGSELHRLIIYRVKIVLLFISFIFITFQIYQVPHCSPRGKTKQQHFYLPNTIYCYGEALTFMQPALFCSP